MQLVIGNKNYSSWSMRPWVLMRQAGIAFEEVQLRFGGGFGGDSRFKRELARYSPAGLVPVLIDPDVDDDTPVDATGPSVRGPLAVWDTLAIAEYLAEKFPERRLWPDAPRERARARSACAEMHSGFTALRTHCPMNVEAHLPEVHDAVAKGLPVVATAQASGWLGGAVTRVEPGDVGSLVRALS